MASCPDTAQKNDKQLVKETNDQRRAVMKKKIREAFKSMRELLDTREKELIKQSKKTNPSTLFFTSSGLAETCKRFGRFYEIENVIVSAERPTKLEQKLVAAHLHVSVQIPNSHITAKIGGKAADRYTECIIQDKGNGKYEISHRPKHSGVYQLHIKLDGEDISGSPFLVTVKTPVEELETAGRIAINAKNPLGVAVNTFNELIMITDDSRLVSVFSSEGTELAKINTVEGSERDHSGVAVAVDSKNNILVVDNENNQLFKFSRKGELIVATEGPGQFKHLVGVCFNSFNKNIYVVDSETNRIHIFNSELKFLNDFGGKGGDDGQLDGPLDIAADSSGLLYVADCGNNRVQVFTPDGKYQMQFKKKKNEELRNPISICVENDTLVYVGEEKSGVSIFTKKGNFLKAFGCWGTELGEFKDPYGIAVDQHGIVYVCDTENNRVQMFQ